MKLTDFNWVILFNWIYYQNGALTYLFGSPNIFNSSYGIISLSFSFFSLIYSSKIFLYSSYFFNLSYLS